MHRHFNSSWLWFSEWHSFCTQHILIMHFASINAVCLRCRAEDKSEQVVVVGQVLASEVNIGFEDIVNTAILQVSSSRIKHPPPPPLAEGLPSPNNYAYRSSKVCNSFILNSHLPQKRIDEQTFIMSGTHLIAYYSSIQCCTLVQGLDPGSSRPIEQVWHMGCKHLVRRRLRSLNPKQKPSETSPSSYQYIATFSTCGYV